MPSFILRYAFALASFQNGEWDWSWNGLTTDLERR